MGIFDLFKKEKAEERENPATPEGRLKAAEYTNGIKQRKQEIYVRERELELEKEEAKHRVELLRLDAEAARYQEQIDRYSYVDEEEHENPTIDPMMGLLVGLLGNKGQSPQNVANSQPQQVDLTEGEISEIMGRFPSEVAMAQKMPDTVIRKMLKSKFPYLSDNSLDLGLAAIKKTEVKEVVK